MEAATGALKVRVDYKMQPGHYGECRGLEKESKGRQAGTQGSPATWVDSARPARFSVILKLPCMSESLGG